MICVNNFEELLLKSEQKKPVRVADQSELFDHLNEFTDGAVGYNHMYTQFGGFQYVMYYTLSDKGIFEVLEVRGVY